MLNTTFIRQVGPARWAVRYGLYQFQKRILQGDLRMPLPSGGSMILPRDHSNAEIFVTNANLDWGAETIFAKHADRSRDFLDIGANIGYYSSYLAPLVRRVYAFEPDSRNHEALHTNANIAGNVSVIPAAVSSRDGTADLSLAHSSAMNTLNTVPGAPTTNVRVTSVDTFVKQQPEIDVGLVKIDIEGHDIEALCGMEQTVAKFQPLILAECGDPKLPEIALRWGYRLFAHVRHRETMAVSFKEMSADSLQRDWYKMVFLAPPHIQLG